MQYGIAKSQKQLSDKEKEIEELHRELEDYTFNYPDFKAENEQLKADLEHHKQSELATAQLLLAEKQKTEQLKAEWQKKSDTNHELIEQLADSNETIADLKAQMKEIKIKCMNKSGGCYHCDNFDCKEIK